MVRLFSFLFLITHALHALQVNLGAPSAILINGDTGAILYEKNAHDQLYPASITKVATALYVLEKKREVLNERVVATKKEIGVINPKVRQNAIYSYPPYLLETDGTSVGIRAGEQFSLKDLLYALLLSSANDAANVLARAASGEIEEFMKELNHYLKEKGIVETQFANPHGLFHPDHWTTAFDMAKITQIAMREPLFREIVKTKSYHTASNKRPSLDFLQHNRLLFPKKPHFYPKAIGVKTGYIAKARHTLIAAAEENGRMLIAVLLGCSSPAEMYKDAQKLFEKAFAEKKIDRKLFTKEYDIFSRKVKGGERLLEASLVEDLTLSYYPSEEPTYRAYVQWDGKEVPIKKGEEVGHLDLITQEGELLIRLPLTAFRDVEGKFFFRLFRKELWHLEYHKYLILVGLILLVAALLYAVLRSRDS